MEIDPSDIKLLEKPVGTLEILLHLLINKRATVTDFIKGAELNQRTTYSALSKLQENGLVVIEKSKGFPVCKFYKLTEKGKNITEHLAFITYMIAMDS